MASETTGGPAFPGGDGEHAGNPQYYSPGMTLRDWFAGQAMQGMLAAEHDNREFGVAGYAALAQEAYAFADAMLAARAASESGVVAS